MLIALMRMFNALARWSWSCRARSRSSPYLPKKIALANAFIASPLFKAPIDFTPQRLT